MVKLVSVVERERPKECAIVCVVELGGASIRDEDGGNTSDAIIPALKQRLQLLLPGLPLRHRHDPPGLPQAVAGGLAFVHIAEILPYFSAVRTIFAVMYDFAIFGTLIPIIILCICYN